MRTIPPLLLALFAPTCFADDPKPILIAKPDAFQTLVNPNCSHCVDEAKRRKDELKDSDPVLCWTRGYSEGGAIPIRFFLNTYRVISDSYGVFVYDPDAGYARGFAPSYNFVFHGWRNGVMVMRDKTDDTLYSCLSGVAFDGPRKGERLTPIPTIVTTWGEVMKRNPNAVAYHMFEKYKPSDLPTKANEESVKSRLARVDPRLKADELVLGVRIGDKTKAYSLAEIAKAGFIEDEFDSTRVAVFYNPTTKTAAAYRPSASQPRKWKGPNPDKNGVSPKDEGEPLPKGSEALPNKRVTFKTFYNGAQVRDAETMTILDIAGRGTDGPLAGWTLEALDAVQCRWFAWSTEYPDTAVYTPPPPPSADKKVRQISGSAEFLRLLPKPFGVIKAIDPKARTVSLLLDGEKTAKVWSIEPDAEVWVNGFWGRLDQFRVNDRVWVWLKLDRTKNPMSVTMIADAVSTADIRGDWWDARKTKHLNGGPGQPHLYEYTLKREKETQAVLVPAGVEADGKPALLYAINGKPALMTEAELNAKRSAQRDHLRKQWAEGGLPGVIAFHHPFSGEMDVMLDHEGMRWGRSLKYGDSVELTADPPIKAVVKSVVPWRERTTVRLVVGELQSSGLKTGQRIGVKMPPPDKAVDESPYPPDLGRKRTDDERVEWFLASTYCVCGVGNDTCTGHFYTLASCNPNGCGAPNATRDEIRDLIAKGKSDREIWDALLKDRGPLMLRPHLKP
jgi:hypothetical protein